MPEAEYVWLPKADVLSFEETRRLVGVFTELGVTKVRLTGGEPLLRKDLPDLVSMLSGLERIEDLALTTNGLLLRAQAQALKDAGLHRITVSLDTLSRERFQELSRRDQLDDVLDGIQAARDVGLHGPQDRHRRAARHERRRDPRAHRLRAGGRRRDSIHRVHGRRRRDAVVR